MKFPHIGSANPPSARVDTLTGVIERVQAEEELESFFRLSLDMLCIAGLDGYFKRLNSTWQKVLGFSTEELLAKPYLEFVHPDDRESTLREAQKLATGANTISFENRYRCKDGSYKWVLWNATPLPGRQLIYAAARDISDRKRDEEALIQAKEEAARVRSEARYRELIEHATCGMYWSTVDGRFLYVNPALVAMLG